MKSTEKKFIILTSEGYFAGDFAGRATYTKKYNEALLYSERDAKSRISSLNYWFSNDYKFEPIIVPVKFDNSGNVCPEYN